MCRDIPAKSFAYDAHVKDMLVFPPESDFHKSEMVSSGRAVLQVRYYLIPVFCHCSAGTVLDPCFLPCLSSSLSPPPLNPCVPLAGTMCRLRRLSTTIKVPYSEDIDVLVFNLAHSIITKITRAAAGGKCLVCIWLHCTFIVTVVFVSCAIAAQSVCCSPWTRVPPASH